MEQSLKSAAIVIGLCSHGLSIVRALASKDIDVFCIEKNFKQPGIKTNKCKKIFAITDYSSTNLLACLADISIHLKKYDSIVLFPSNDRHVKSLFEISHLIQPNYKISWLHCAEKIIELLEKKNIEAEAVKKKLNYPKSFVVNKQDIQPIGNKLDLNYPAIMKPNAPLSSFKTEIVASDEQLDAKLNTYLSQAPLLVQEYIAGDDSSIFFCALFYDKGTEIAYLCGQKIRSHPPGRGQTTIANTVIDDEVYTVARKFFEGLSISGPVSLEVKKDPVGKIWIIEPTVGRTDFWSELCIAAGFNLPYLEYCLALGMPLKQPGSFSEVMWYDSERSPESYLRDVLHYKSIYPNRKKPVFSYLSKSDIKPFLYSTLKLLKKYIF